MRFTFTPGAGSISKVVITGPGPHLDDLALDAEVGQLGLEDLRALRSASSSTRTSSCCGVSSRRSGGT